MARQTWVNQYDLSAHCHGVITSNLSVTVWSTAKTCIQKIIMIKIVKIIEGESEEIYMLLEKKSCRRNFDFVFKEVLRVRG